MISHWKNIKPFGLRLKTQNIELNALAVYDERYMKTKITYGDKVYANFRG